MRGILYSKKDRPRFINRRYTAIYWIEEVLATGGCTFCAGSMLIVCLAFVWVMVRCLLHGQC